MSVDIATRFDMQQVLAPDGSVVGDVPDLADDELVDLYRLMVRSRIFDRRAMAAQRQGRLGTYPMLEGQEAAQIGSAAALGESDFVYPAYREHGVQIARGLPIEVMLAYWQGLPATGVGRPSLRRHDPLRTDRFAPSPRRRSCIRRPAAGRGRRHRCVPR